MTQTICIYSQSPTPHLPPTRGGCGGVESTEPIGSGSRTQPDIYTVACEGCSQLGLPEPQVGDRIRGTLGDRDPLNKVPV